MHYKFSAVNFGTQSKHNAQELNHIVRTRNTKHNSSLSSLSLSLARATISKPGMLDLYY